MEEANDRSTCEMLKDKARAENVAELCHCLLDAFLMGAGSGELSLTEMSIETAIGQIDKQ